jgi:large subunit ribosomal protein L24
MKIKFKKSWKASSQPRKQRKYVAKAPLHIKNKLVSANLSEDLRKKHNMRNITLRKGDSVLIMRGKFRGKKGKVTKILLKTSKIIIDGIQIKKKDGSKIDVKMEPSNLQIQELNMEDKKRIKRQNHQEGSAPPKIKEKENK